LAASGSQGRTAQGSSPPKPPHPAHAHEAHPPHLHSNRPPPHTPRPHTIMNVQRWIPSTMEVLGPVQRVCRRYSPPRRRRVTHHVCSIDDTCEEEGKHPCVDALPRALLRCFDCGPLQLLRPGQVHVPQVPLPVLLPGLLQGVWCRCATCFVCMHMGAAPGHRAIGGVTPWDQPRAHPEDPSFLRHPPNAARRRRCRGVTCCVDCCGCCNRACVVAWNGCRPTQLHALRASTSPRWRSTSAARP
jgi:hypothetical protein